MYGYMLFQLYAERFTHAELCRANDVVNYKREYVKKKKFPRVALKGMTMMLMIWG